MEEQVAYQIKLRSNFAQADLTAWIVLVMHTANGIHIAVQLGQMAVKRWSGTNIKNNAMIIWVYAVLRAYKVKNQYR